MKIFYQLLLSLKGLNFLSVKGLCYTWDEKKFETQILILNLTDQKVISISCDALGESLIISNEEPKPIDMEEDGKLVIRDLSKYEFLAYIDQKVEDVYLWKNEYDSFCGIELVFNGLKLFVFNLGDELQLYNDQPSFLEVESYTKHALI